MSLFFNYTRPGPGVSPDEPRKTGLPRIWEMISRDFKTFWLSGLLNLLLTLPLASGLGLACLTGSLLIALLAGSLGGMIAAPGFYGLADTLLCSLRDEPGFWWHRYRRVQQKSWKGTLLPGALAGTIFSLQLFTLVHMPALNGGLGLFACQVFSMMVAAGLFVWALPQAVLLELSFPALVKNSLLLFFRFLPKTVLAALLALGFVLLVWLLLPVSLVPLLVVGLWLPLLCIFQIIYPKLDEVFSIEETLKHP